MVYYGVSEGLITWGGKIRRLERTHVHLDVLSIVVRHITVVVVPVAPLAENLLLEVSN